MRIEKWELDPIERIEHLYARKGGGVTALGSLPITLGTVKDLPISLSGLILTADLQGRELLPPTKRQRAAKQNVHREGRLLLGEVLIPVLSRMAQEGKIPPLAEMGAILAGDFWAEPGCTRRGRMGDVSPVWMAFHSHCKWVAGVLGNHDKLTALRSSPKGLPDGMALLDGSTAKLSGLNIAGVDGIIGDPSKLRKKAESHYLGLLSDQLQTKPDVVVLHEAPAQSEAGDRGRQSIRDCLLEHSPTLVVCGHCHWQDPLVELSNGGQICNVDGRVMILTSEH